MPKLSSGKASTTVADGVLRKIPGMSAGYNLDRAPMLVHSGKLDLVDAVAEQGAVYIPFDATIVAIRSRVRTACGTGPGTASLMGVVKGVTAYAAQAHATTDDAGTELDWTIDTADVAEGEVLYFAGDGGATTTGDCDVTVVLIPR